MRFHIFVFINVNQTWQKILFHIETYFMPKLVNLPSQLEFMYSNLKLKSNILWGFFFFTSFVASFPYSTSAQAWSMSMNMIPTWASIPPSYILTSSFLSHGKCELNVLCRRCCEDAEGQHRGRLEEGDDC